MGSEMPFNSTYRMKSDLMSEGSKFRVCRNIVHSEFLEQTAAGHWTTGTAAIICQLQRTVD